MMKIEGLKLCVVVLVFHVSHCFFLSPSYLRPYPSELHKLEGSNFTLSCTITKMSLVENGCDASHIYFENTTSVFPRDMVEVQNNYTAVLSIYNAKKKYQSYYCGFYKNSTACDESMGTFHVVVAKRLEPSRDFRCVLDSWLNMTCTWEPKRELNKETGFVPGTYMFEEGYPPVNIDTKKNGNSYTWNFGPGNVRSLHQDIQFQILVNNSLGETWSPMLLVSPLDKVKLRPLESVKVAVKGPYVCEFTWRSPVSRNSLVDISSLELEYHMTLVANGKNKEHHWTRPCYQSTWTLHDLTPNTEYTYSFSVRPNGRGYMSDPVSGSFSTPEDVPSASPTLYEGGYTVNSDVGDKNNSQSITIYWKKIADGERNGEIIHHKILVERVHSDPVSHSTETFISPGNNQKGEVTLMKNFSYNIWVLACTKVGCHGEHPRSRSTIFDKNKMSVPTFAQRKASLSKYFVIEEEKTVLQVRWNSGKADGADIFWRNLNSQRGLESSGHIKTQPGQLQNYSIMLPPGSQYIHYEVGLSVSEGHDHSGITWSGCIYVADGLIAPPENVNVEQDSEHGSLMVRWKEPGCGANMAYPTEFLIYYCVAYDQNSEKCKDTVETKIVSGETFSLLLTGLRQGEWYMVWMKSRSGHNESFKSGYHYKETSRHWLTTGVLAAFVGVSIPVGIVALFGIFCLCKKFLKVKNYYLHPEVEILPEVPPDIKGYDNFVVSKQMSMDSTDSGVSSVSGWHREHLNSIGSEADSVFSNDHCPTCGSKKAPSLPVVREESFENSGSSLDGLQTYCTTPPPNGYLAPIADDRNEDRIKRGQLCCDQQQNTSFDSLDKDGSISAYAQINGAGISGSLIDDIKLKNMNQNGYIPNDMKQTSNLHGLNAQRSNQAGEMLQNERHKKHDNFQFHGYVDHQNFNKPEVSLNRHLPNPDSRATRFPVQAGKSKNDSGLSVEMTSLKPVQTGGYVDEGGQPVMTGLVSAGGYVDENGQPVSRQVTVTCSDPAGTTGYIPHNEMNETTAFRPGEENEGAMFSEGEVTAENISKDDEATFQKEFLISKNQPDGYVLENDLETMCNINPEKHARYIPDSSQNVGEVPNPDHAEKEPSGEETCGATKRKVPSEGKSFKEFEERGYVGAPADGDFSSASAQIDTTLSTQEATSQSAPEQDPARQTHPVQKLVNQSEQRQEKDNHSSEGQGPASRLLKNQNDSGMLVGQGYITQDTIMLTNEDDDLLSRSQPQLPKNSENQLDDMNPGGYIDSDTMAQLGQKYCPFSEPSENNIQISGSQKGAKLSIDVKGNDGDTESDDSGICSPVVHDSVKFPENTKQEKLVDGYVPHHAIV